MRALLHLAAPFALLAASGCGNAEPADAPDSEARAAWVGALDGTDARVGLVREGAHLAFYVCGGPTSLSSTRWFRGDVRADGTIELTSGDAMLRASSRDGGWSGSLTMAPDPIRTFQIRPARVGTAEDVYEGRLDGGNVGVVVTNDTMQGAFRALDGSTAQVLPVRTVERTPQGLAVQVILSGGPRELFVLPARAKL